MRKRGRPRKYPEKIRCPECGSNWCKKFGKNTGKQRYKCNECGRLFYEGAKYHKHPEKIKLLSLKMYSEGMSKSAISVVLVQTNPQDIKSFIIMAIFSFLRFYYVAWLLFFYFHIIIL
ncbi:IS1/IS1595 family N-terminal zinc-binding domain-containing protein [Persephonella sp.]